MEILILGLGAPCLIALMFVILELVVVAIKKVADVLNSKEEMLGIISPNSDDFNIDDYKSNIEVTANNSDYLVYRGDHWVLENRENKGFLLNKKKYSIRIVGKYDKEFEVYADCDEDAVDEAFGELNDFCENAEIYTIEVQ